MKRSFDCAASAFGLMFLSPLLFLCALLIKLEDGGSVFYRGERIGRFGQPFSIFKFRTMVTNADAAGVWSTASDDPRITRVGKFIRRLKLDEVPQLINVLIGDMSLVGPRPDIPLYANQLTGAELSILNVRPGLTDLATLWNPDEEAILEGHLEPDKVYAEKIRPVKVKLQIEYVRTASFMVDLRILVRTVMVILIPVSRRRQIDKVRMAIYG